MSPNSYLNFTFSDAFGYHTSPDQIMAKVSKNNDRPPIQTKENYNKTFYSLNTIKFLDYIPVLGTISAILKLSMVYFKALNENENFYKGLIIRSLITLCSCGTFLIIPDLIVTISRTFFFNVSSSLH